MLSRQVYEGNFEADARELFSRMIRFAGLESDGLPLMVHGNCPHDAEVAFSRPNGKFDYLGVCENITTVVHNKAQLAAIIGHELAHVKLKHNRRAEDHAVGVFQHWLKAVGARFAYTPEGAEDFKKSVCPLVQAESRKEETEADKLGMEFMVRAGFDPYQAGAIWIYQSNYDREAGLPDPVMHPPPLGRGLNLFKYAEILERSRASWKQK
jgi:peptidase M48-like protein